MTIIKKFEIEEAKKSFPKKYIALTLVGLFALIITEIWASNTVIAYGEKFEKLSVLEKNLKIENQILQNEIAKRASLSNIASESAKLGFSDTQSVLYIR